MSAQENPPLSPYLQRLAALQKLGLLPHQGGELPSKTSEFAPKIVFMDTPQGVAEVGDALAMGWPVITDYGATYGTTFPPHIREAVALARGEVEPLPTVSIVTFRDVAYGWMDTSRIHPDIVKSLNAGKFDILNGIAFMRYSCNDVCQKTLGRHYVNAKQEVQVFIVEDVDPLMSYLRREHRLAYIAVRSSNVTGQQEEAFPGGALKYAASIGSPILAVRTVASLTVQQEDEQNVRENLYDKLKRKRYGSQPIVTLSSVDEPPAITLTRAGNTDPATLQRLMADIIADGIGFVYIPEKVTNFTRPMYAAGDDVRTPQDIRQSLLRHSGLI
ncbi:MAG: hypothetical protein WC841_05675 [Candidatus Shapirobacteria bacterium]|jgi:hypothetical protein